MKINVQSIHFDADKKLLEFIEKKAERLDHFFDQIIRGDIYLKLEHTVDDANKICEIKIAIPGNDLFCKEQAKTFEAATDMAIECIKNQIHKHKERVKNHVSNHKQVAAKEDYF
ncbi:MAG: ribosome hibernation-promoting factor, HPF/YfiA family [Sphingobacteriaceae bacterium]